MAEPDPVTLAYVHDIRDAHSWTKSFVELIGYDMANHGRVIRGGWSAWRYGTGGIEDARNMAVVEFLDTDVPWLFWVDTDMGFPPDIVDRLVDVADPVKRPIVGALAFAQKETNQDGVNGFRCAARPTILDLVDLGAGRQFTGRANYPVNTVTQCAATGSACILIHRSVFEKIAVDHGPNWYSRIRAEDGSRLGEDVSFCVRAGAAGFPVFVHTGVKTTHLKHVWLGEQDFWDQQVAPPATDPTAVVVPVLWRPQNAEPFMRSLRASTGVASVYAVAHEGDVDTCKAWEQVGAQVIYWTGSTGTFAEKVNEGYRQTSEPWLFLVGDDVRFHPGWLDHAQHTAHLYGASVIGTNDLGNPRVMAGEHATHVLVRRDYIDEIGASWDGPGVVAHEGYRHWYVDDEIVAAAKQRGLWAMSLASKVEHLHPVWGKAETDDVYELGQSTALEDRKLHMGRLKAYR